MSTAVSTINLEKGQKIDLTKTNPGVLKYVVGLGWNPNTSAQADLDCSAFILGENDKLLSEKHFVFYNNLNSPENAVVHTGDNTTGEGEGDDERINIDFSKIPEGARKIVFVVTIHKAQERSQNFGQVNGCYIRIMKDDEEKTQLLNYDLNEDYSVETAVEFGNLYLNNGEWKFQAMGTGAKEGLSHYVTKYQ